MWILAVELKILDPCQPATNERCRPMRMQSNTKEKKNKKNLKLFKLSAAILSASSSDDGLLAG